MSFNSPRNILNAFMDSGIGNDGDDGPLAYVNCFNKTSVSGGPTGICNGILIGSTSDAATVATLRCKGRSVNNIATLKLSLNEVHAVSIDRLYENGAIGNANDVVIFFE